MLTIGFPLSFVSSNTCLQVQRCGTAKQRKQSMSNRSALAEKPPSAMRKVGTWSSAWELYLEGVFLGGVAAAAQGGGQRLPGLEAVAELLVVARGQHQIL